MLAVKIIIACVIGAFFSRMCGRKSVIPLGLEQWLYALPYLFVTQMPLTAVTGVACVAAYLSAVVGKRTGHGQYLDLGYGIRQPEENDEPLDFIVRLFFGKDDGKMYWRSVAGMAVTGLSVTLLPGLCYGWMVNPTGGAIIAISGATKGMAYMIGWALSRRGLILHATEMGEHLTGAFGWAIFSAIYFTH